MKFNLIKRNLHLSTSASLRIEKRVINACAGYADEIEWGVVVVEGGDGLGFVFSVDLTLGSGARICIEREGADLDDVVDTVSGRARESLQAMLNNRVGARRRGRVRWAREAGGLL